MGFTPLQLTLGQLRKTVSLSKETFRHWRLVLPPLQDRKGRAPSYSSGDAIALTVLHSLTNDWGIQIGSLQRISVEIFRLCNSTPWMTLENNALLIDIGQQQCTLESTGKDVKRRRPVLLYPLQPVMEKLRNEFLNTDSNVVQRELSLPPTSITKRRIDRRRA
jgi:hypothetical protein